MEILQSIDFGNPLATSDQCIGNCTGKHQKKRRELS